MVKSIWSAALLLIAGTLVVHAGTPKPPDNEVLTDHQMAQIYGIGESTGCNPIAVLLICQQASFSCPNAPGHDAYGSGAFPACNQSGTLYSNNQIDTVQTATNMRIDLRSMVDCYRSASCSPGNQVNDARWINNQCQGTYPDYKCRTCSLVPNVVWTQEPTHDCLDP